MSTVNRFHARCTQALSIRCCPHLEAIDTNVLKSVDQSSNPRNVNLAFITRTSPIDFHFMKHFELHMLGQSERRLTRLKGSLLPTNDFISLRNAASTSLACSFMSLAVRFVKTLFNHTFRLTLNDRDYQNFIAF